LPGYLFEAFRTLHHYNQVLLLLKVVVVKVVMPKLMFVVAGQVKFFT
jgi:hypothetical protein